MEFFISDFLFDKSSATNTQYRRVRLATWKNMTLPDMEIYLFGKTN